MLLYICFLWIGIKLSAPWWYFVVIVVSFVLNLILNINEAKIKQKIKEHLMECSGRMFKDEV